MSYRGLAKVGLVAAFAMSGQMVRADVLQIETDGARWVAGPKAVAAAQSASGNAATLTTAQLTNARLSIAPPAEYAEKVNELAERYDLSPALIEALVWQESRWRHDARSHKGAQGLAQLMPGTARDMGVDARDPFANLEGGARYLRIQLNRFGGDLEKALAAYNAGPERVARANGVPRIRETEHYVASIMGRLAYANSLSQE